MVVSNQKYIFSLLRNICISYVLVPLYDFVVSPNVIAEKRDRKPLIFFKIIKWHAPTASYLRKVDQSSTLVSEAFAIAESTLKSITVPKTTRADEFIKNYSIDKNGNV